MAQEKKLISLAPSYDIKEIKVYKEYLDAVLSEKVKVV